MMELITAQEAAKMLGMSVQTVYNQVYRSRTDHGKPLLMDKIKVYRVGGRLRFNRQEIDKFIKSCEVKL
jgi:predicted DNA-binding transcriptional regulator AlpA